VKGWKAGKPEQDSGGPGEPAPHSQYTKYRVRFDDIPLHASVDAYPDRERTDYTDGKKNDSERVSTVCTLILQLCFGLWLCGGQPVPYQKWFTQSDVNTPPPRIRAICLILCGNISPELCRLFLPILYTYLNSEKPAGCPFFEQRRTP